MANKIQCKTHGEWYYNGITAERVKEIMKSRLPEYE
jgi:hypothetical protein